MNPRILNPTTIPRPELLNTLEPCEAARQVDKFIGAPQKSGPWVIEPFTVDRMGATVSALKGAMNEGGRWTPEGDYIYLRNTEFNPDRERLTPDDPDYGTGGFTMMSNTPDELSDHQGVFDHAEGRVLITGLGLSCVVSGLLAKPEVEHIDVVEYDQNIINMVGPAYEDERRVTIFQGDASTFEFPSNVRWDFAWHDIWAKISSDNLDPDEAENGITYETLFRRYAAQATLQEAWAFPLALGMRRAAELRDEWLEDWSQEWVRSTPAERIDSLLAFQSDTPFGPPKEAYRQLLQQTGDLAKIEERSLRDDPPSLYVEEKRFLPAAQVDLPDLLDAEYESYGLTLVNGGQATKGGS
jgi:hypothetical protein